MVGRQQTVCTLVRALALIFGTNLAFAAHADEYYKFYRIRCDPTLTGLKIQKEGIWNIGDEIWGNGSWEDHVQALKSLEDEGGLYLIDQSFGYDTFGLDDGKAVVINCGTIRAQIDFDSIPQTDYKRRARMNPRVTITANQVPLVSSVYIAKLYRVEIYLERNGPPRINVCLSDVWCNPYVLMPDTPMTQQVAEAFIRDKFVTDPERVALENLRERAAKLKIGMSTDEVAALLGYPQCTTPKSDNPDKWDTSWAVWEMWTYGNCQGDDPRDSPKLYVDFHDSKMATWEALGY